MCMFLNSSPGDSSCGGRRWTLPWPSCPWCPPCCRSTQWGCSRKPCTKELSNGKQCFDPSTIPDQVSVPVGNVLVSHSGCHVEHDDCTLALQRDMDDINPTQKDHGKSLWNTIFHGTPFNLDVVAVPQSTKLLLTSCVPHVEPWFNFTWRQSIVHLAAFHHFTSLSDQIVYASVKPDGAAVGVEDQGVNLDIKVNVCELSHDTVSRMTKRYKKRWISKKGTHLHSKGCHILLLKLASQVTLHKGGLSWRKTAAVTRKRAKNICSKRRTVWS